MNENQVHNEKIECVNTGTLIRLSNESYYVIFAPATRLTYLLTLKPPDTMFFYIDISLFIKKHVYKNQQSYQEQLRHCADTTL